MKNYQIVITLEKFQHQESYEMYYTAIEIDT